MLDEAMSSRVRPAVLAIGGLQGTGKSTLAAQLVAMAHARGIAAVALSIDDFYLQRCDRVDLGRQVHPLLATRGPPGTHDVALACRVLDQLMSMRGDAPVRLPRFDKISDRRLSTSHWAVQEDRPQLIVFEGWFLEVPPEPDHALATPINDLERDEDPDGGWRRYVNRALALDYTPLWLRFQRLVVLKGPGFEVVPGWRWQQERTLQAANPRRRTMTRPQVERFVQFFERVSRQALRTWPSIAGRVIEIDAQRNIVSGA